MREKASASPPRIMVLMVLPLTFSTTNVARAESGIDKKTAVVARKLPRNIRIIRLVRNSPIKPSCSRGSNGFFHEGRLVEDDRCHQLLGDIEQMADHVANAIHHFDGVGVARPAS